MRDNDGNVCVVDKHEEGGTHVIGGTTTAWLNVTYNYSEFYYDALDKKKGIRWLYGKTGKECVARLHSAVRALGTVQDEDYWEPTSGNAGYALSIS